MRSEAEVSILTLPIVICPTSSGCVNVYVIRSVTLSGMRTSPIMMPSRPEVMVIEDVLMTGDQQALVRVRFSGENAQPLRFWQVHMVREDHWENKEGRWWILPGKL